MEEQDRIFAILFFGYFQSQKHTFKSSVDTCCPFGTDRRLLKGTSNIFTLRYQQVNRISI
jgi:hypothetical protein